MNIQRVFDAARELSAALEGIGLPFCFIGGDAVQRWGEPRLTIDADVTVVTSWVGDEKLVDALLKKFTSRRADARNFALEFRVLLLQTAEGGRARLGVAARHRPRLAYLLRR